MSKRRISVGRAAWQALFFSHKESQRFVWGISDVDGAPIGASNRPGVVEFFCAFLWQKMSPPGRLGFVSANGGTLAPQRVGSPLSSFAAVDLDSVGEGYFFASHLHLAHQFVLGKDLPGTNGVGSIDKLSVGPTDRFEHFL